MIIMADDKLGRPPEMDLVIGRRIKESRKSRKMSQTSLASEVGVAWQQIQKYEGGKNRVSASMLWKIADVFDMPVSYFFSDIAEDFEKSEIIGKPKKAKAPAREDRVVELFSQLGNAEKDAVFSFLKSVAKPETQISEPEVDVTVK